MLVGGMLTAIGCADDAPPELSANDRVLVDSLFKERVTAVRVGVEARCDSVFDERVRYYADSLVRERTAERERYLQRIQRELEQ